MDLRSIIFKNIRRNLRRYLGYLLASTLAIAVFDMFLIFATNPNISGAYAPAAARVLFYISLVIVAIFAIFFIFYFHAALIRVRSKEFGLLLTLGMARGQIGRMIFYESVFIGLIALVVGIGLGVAGSLPFMLAVSSILALPKAIPFALAPVALWVTVIYFGAVFLLDALLISARVTLRTPRMLILGAREQQHPPRASLIKVILGLFCIAAAYVMATAMSDAIVLNAIPIVGLTIIGTYFLFSQVFVMLLSRLRRRPLKGTSLLTVSRLAYRIKDYARMITTVTVLNAVVLVGMGSVFGMQQLFLSQAGRAAPFPLQFVASDAHAAPLSDRQIRDTLASHHLTLQNELTTSLLLGKTRIKNGNIPIQETSVTVLSYSDYQRLMQALRQAEPDAAAALTFSAPLSGDQAYVYAAYITPHGQLFPDAQMKLQIGKTSRSLHVSGESTGNALDSASAVGSLVTAIVSDATYANLSASAPADARWHAYTYSIANWQQSQPAVDALRARLSQDDQELLSDRVTGYVQVTQLFAVMLFAGFFVSLLFFLAAGCSLYFKLFNQQEEDKRQFGALERIGVQKREVTRVLTLEFLLLFFIPVAIAAIHGGVAMIDLQNLFQVSWTASSLPMWNAFGIVCLCYLLCFALFFWAARVNYYRRMRTVN